MGKPNSIVAWKETAAELQVPRLKIQSAVGNHTIDTVPGRCIRKSFCFKEFELYLDILETL